MDIIIIPETAKRVKDICDTCHREFNRTKEWQYKGRTYGKKKLYFCSYTCYRIWQKAEQKKFMERYKDDFIGIP